MDKNDDTSYEDDDYTYDEAIYEPPEKKRRRVNPLTSFLRFIFLISVLGVFLFLFFLQQLSTGNHLEQNTIVVVEPGDGLRRIAGKLEQSGAVLSANLFVMGAMVYGQSQALQAGEYDISTGESAYDLLQKFSQGKVMGRQITFAEGLSNRQIAALLVAEEALSGEIETMPQEGHLLPTTVSFTGGQSRQSVIDRLTALHKEALDGIWAERARGLPVSTPEELVILASIVEKETAIADERQKVAAVFINRLKRGMRLQSDPTIIYGLTKGLPLGRGIRKSELESADNPYNTYKIDRLPPTAIANPGREAMMAVAHPAEVDYIFFVADGTGGHAFASTLKEHRANVKKWRSIESEKKKVDETNQALRQ